jgi:hypothetical protein
VHPDRLDRLVRHGAGGVTHDLRDVDLLDHVGGDGRQIQLVDDLLRDRREIEAADDPFDVDPDHHALDVDAIHDPVEVHPLDDRVDVDAGRDGIHVDALHDSLEVHAIEDELREVELIERGVGDPTHHGARERGGDPFVLGAALAPALVEAEHRFARELEDGSVDRVRRERHHGTDPPGEHGHRPAAGATGRERDLERRAGEGRKRDRTHGLAGTWELERPAPGVLDGGRHRSEGEAHESQRDLRCPLGDLERAVAPRRGHDDGARARRVHGR